MLGALALGAGWYWDRRWRWGRQRIPPWARWNGMKQTSVKRQHPELPHFFTRRSSGLESRRLPCPCHGDIHVRPRQDSWERLLAFLSTCLFGVTKDLGLHCSVTHLLRHILVWSWLSPLLWIPAAHWSHDFFNYSYGWATVLHECLQCCCTAYLIKLNPSLTGRLSSRARQCVQALSAFQRFHKLPCLHMK